MKKICKKCGRFRKIGKFGKDSQKADGKRIYCRDCIREYNKRTKNNKKKYIKRWKNKNKDIIKEYNKNYYIKNKQRILYNKRAREDTENILISESSKKHKQVKINKDRQVCIITIDPKRKK